MTRAELVAEIQRLADEPLNGYPRRRKGLPAEVAGEMVDAMLDEVLRAITPVLEREWCGGEVLSRIHLLRGLAAPHSHERPHDVGMPPRNGKSSP